MSWSEPQITLIDAVCGEDDAQAVSTIDAALAAGADFTTDGIRPLFFATSRKTTVVLLHLFARGATLSAERDAGNGDTALHEAAMNGRDDMLLVLFDNGGREFLDSFDESFCRTPLCWATEKGHLSTVRLLLAHGATVDHRCEDKAEETALNIAVQMHHLELTELLLQHGADPDAWGWLGNTPRSRVTDAPPEFARLFHRFDAKRRHRSR